jgi:hypothetical protein
LAKRAQVEPKQRRGVALVLLLVMIGVLFWPTESGREEAAASEDRGAQPDGFQPAGSYA